MWPEFIIFNVTPGGMSSCQWASNSQSKQLILVEWSAFTPWPLYQQGKSSWYPPNRRLSEAPGI